MLLVSLVSPAGKCCLVLNCQLLPGVRQNKVGLYVCVCLKSSHRSDVASHATVKSVEIQSQNGHSFLIPTTPNLPSLLRLLVPSDLSIRILLRRVEVNKQALVKTSQSGSATRQLRLQVKGTGKSLSDTAVDARRK